MRGGISGRATASACHRAAMPLCSRAMARVLAQVLALDVIEHGATACARNNLEAALDLLAKAKAAIPGTTRLDVIRARLLAAADRYDEALESARAAAKGGSVHAMALAANI